MVALSWLFGLTLHVMVKRSPIMDVGLLVREKRNYFAVLSAMNEEVVTPAEEESWF